MKFFAWMAVVVSLLGGSVMAEDWPQFRGGAALSQAPFAKVPLAWDAAKNVAWRTTVPGAGWSQPVVSGDRVFLTTAVAPSGGRPSGMMGGVMSLSTWGMGSAPSEPIQFRVLCLDRAAGGIIWSKTVADVKPTFGKHTSNTFATETPCGSPDGVYAFFGATGTVVALDRDGNERWRRELGPQPTTNQFGTGSSPLLAQDSQGRPRLFVQLYNDDRATLVCLDAATGADVWTANRDKGTSWATPVAWNNDGAAEVITAGQGMVIAYDVDTGAERWRFGGIDTSFACSVVADAEGVYFGTSSPGSRAPAYAIARGCQGDLTLPAGATQGGKVLWSKTKCGAGMPSPVVIGDHLYFLDKIAVCFDKRTGAEKYRKRLPGGSTAVGSPLVIGDRIYLVNERGKVVVLQAGPEFKVLAESSVGSGDEIFWATPAVTEDSLLIRSTDALYCIR
ncbi:MAG: PQQ-binding-like beta-propeller repeat protein [Planctomycetia bacterium]